MEKALLPERAGTMGILNGAQKGPAEIIVCNLLLSADLN